MSDRPDYRYPQNVAYQVAARDHRAYRLAAEFINRTGYDILSVQHEYGIFGGEAGAYLLSLIREVRMPIVTTLHTVLREPSAPQKLVMDELLDLSERVVVMSQRAVGILVDVHGLDPNKIDLIPHGIPDIPKAANSEFRASLAIDGPMILTFGLLSPDKGVEFVIEAMPAILAASPKAIYFVVGTTHPHVRAEHGEAYRDRLVKLAKDLGVAESVRFENRFVSSAELVEYLAAMDVYITPYLNPKQITSGTLAYAVGAGKAVISTPYTYAEELLGDGRGLLVPFRDPAAIAEAVVELERNPAHREEMGQRAAAFGQQMIWPEVAKRYLETFSRAKQDSTSRLRALIQMPTPATKTLPELHLGHLTDLSDDTGIFQHATFTVPNRAEGYCVDDNARALLLTAFLEAGRRLPSEIALLQSRYLSFVMDAFNPANGRFRNFMSYGRAWLEDEGSEDSHGRSMWGLGAMVHRCADPGRRDAARAFFEQGAPALYETSSLRTWAYGILAADEFLRARPDEWVAKALLEAMATRLFAQFQLNQSANWPWFENRLTYANARLPQALLMAGRWLGNKEMTEAGLTSLAWLTDLQKRACGCFAPIGSEGFYHQGGERSYFDQQPVEAWCSVSACLTAHEFSEGSTWIAEAHRAFGWFLGDNMLNQPLYDTLTGGCHDGLHPDRVNRNQGAESTLSFLCALAELRAATHVSSDSWPKPQLL